MTDKIKVVIWDMGGVFLRSQDLTPRADLANEYGLTIDEIHRLVFDTDSARRATIGQISDVEHWQNTGAVLGISGDKLQDFRKRFFEGDQVDFTLIDFIRGLKPNYTTGLLSNAWSDTRNLLTNIRPCIDAFHVSVFSCEAGLAKPDPAIYAYITRLCGILPQEAIFVDDFIENVESANQFGIHAIQFKNTEQAVHDVKSLLDGVQG